MLNRDSERIPRCLLARSKNPDYRGQREAEIPSIGAAGLASELQIDFHPYAWPTRLKIRLKMLLYHP